MLDCMVLDQFDPSECLLQLHSAIAEVIECRIHTKRIRMVYDELISL